MRAWTLLTLAALALPGPALAQRRDPAPLALAPGQRATFEDQRGFRQGGAVGRGDGTTEFVDQRGFRTGRAVPRGDGTIELRDARGFRTGVVRPR